MSNNILIGIAAVSNILCVVGVVICNKYIVDVDGFNFMVFLSFLHFCFTTFGTRVLLFADIFKYKDAAISSVVPVSVGSLLSVAFMNLNLAHNSVGFYQLSKLVCIPFTLMVQFLAYNQTVSGAVQLTLLPITFGVGYATVHDIDINFLGTVFATCAVVATSMAQIWTNSYQKSLDCNALQLLYHTSPIITMGMLILSPFFDDMHALRHHEYTSACLCRIVLSCFFALGVNITNYVVLGQTSPLTYQVLGHLKTILILFLGVVMFNKSINFQNMVGVVIAMFGVIAYTELRRRQSSTTLPTSNSANK